jgi:hypothetical protein
MKTLDSKERIGGLWYGSSAGESRECLPAIVLGHSLAVTEAVRGLPSAIQVARV